MVSVACYHLSDQEKDSASTSPVLGDGCMATIGAIYGTLDGVRVF